MKILTEGHVYELSSLDGTIDQKLQFIRKEINEETKKFETVMDGTTDEEVISMLVNRMGVLQARVPCRETALVITKLEEALMWIGHRKADRVKRGVECSLEK